MLFLSLGSTMDHQKILEQPPKPFLTTGPVDKWWFDDFVEITFFVKFKDIYSEYFFMPMLTSIKYNH